MRFFLILMLILVHPFGYYWAAKLPVRTDGATRLLTFIPFIGGCLRLHASNGLSLDPLPRC